MWKAACLALGCLLGMGAVLALAPAGDRILSDATAALPSTIMSTRAVEEADEALVVNTSSKADRLLSAVSDQAAPTKVPVKAIKLAPTSDKNPPTKPAPKRGRLRAGIGMSARRSNEISDRAGATKEYYDYELLTSAAKARTHSTVVAMRISEKYSANMATSCTERGASTTTYRC